MDADRNKGEAAVEHLKNVILASAKLNVNMVTTFIGRDQTKTVEENLLLVKKYGNRSSGWQKKTA